jgi:alpha-glucuronidase
MVSFRFLLDHRRRSWRITLAAPALFAVLSAPAQTADQAWLRYIGNHAPSTINSGVGLFDHSPLAQAAAQELTLGIARLTARSSNPEGTVVPGPTIVGTLLQIRKNFPALPVPAKIEPEGYWLYWNSTPGKTGFVVAGADDRGVLYGAFALLRLLTTDADLTHLNLRSAPALPIRWVDNWDNPDGSIERGYAGRSIFFEGGNVREDLAPVSEYGRLLASIGINGCNINNVNAAPQLIDSAHLKQIARIADALRPWGVHLAMSVAIASPQTIGGLTTYDPLDAAVKAWWAAKANEIYILIPDFAGFTVKADSEGQPGPASFGRTPADAANTLAAALAPHGGIVLYRAFVYNHHLDWHDPKADRARAAYDIFHPLDGKFAPNVIVQTKEGPIDFQVREPVSPLFAGLHHTAQAMELQITQEYTGQQRHLVYLAPMWKWVLDTKLDTDLHANNQPTTVAQILEGAGGFNPLTTGSNSVAFRPRAAFPSSPCQRFVSGQEGFVSGHDFSHAENAANKTGALAPAPTACLGGIVGVSGIGRDHWLSSPLALANLYAFGRLAWDPNLDPAAIADEWTRQTISTDPQVVATVQKMLMQSWPAYESYTGPLGLQTLTDITGSHYGPNIESSERNGWGQWHDADALGVGKDRTVSTGSGYADQYPPSLAKLYEDPATTPDNLLLFFHHVPYTYKLHNGKTVIQYLYDSHYDGAAQAAQFVRDWQSLQTKLNPALYADVRARLEYQAGHAIVWRDAVVQYFFKLSGIPDEKARAGHYPNRLEAEDAKLAGYEVIDVTPWEDSSGGKAVSCDQPACTAEWTFTGTPGHYDIAIQYFDLPNGAAKFTLLINHQPAATWLADANLPSTRPNGDNSTRKTLSSIQLNSGDTISIEGTPDGQDPAALDYIELTRLPTDRPVF